MRGFGISPKGRFAIRLLTDVLGIRLGVGPGMKLLECCNERRICKAFMRPTRAWACFRSV